MDDDRVEDRIREYYDSEGWVLNGDGKTAEDVLFRDLEGADAYREKTGFQPCRLFDGFSGTLLIVGGGDLPIGHVRATEGFKKVVCIEISQRALELSKKKLGDKGEYHKASALCMPLLDSSVDAVLCAHVLYHVHRANQELAVNEMIRVTRKGGRIVIVYPNPNAPLMMIQRFLKGLGMNRLLGKTRLYVYYYPVKWWKHFGDRCLVTILPNDAISTNQARALLPTIGLRRTFFRWASEFEDVHPSVAAKLWSYVTVILDKLDCEASDSFSRQRESDSCGAPDNRPTRNAAPI